MDRQRDSALSQEIEKAEIVAGVRRALDVHYQRFCRLARADWERLIGPDPADACVTVRIQPSVATRGSGFLKSRRGISKPVAQSSLPRFAH
jgi:hypothetical protein